MRILTEKELENLTHRKRSKEQCAALRAMGIPFAVRPDGSPCVIDDAVRERMGMGAREESATINLKAING